MSQSIHEYFCEMYRSIKLDLNCTGRYWISLLLLHSVDAGCLTSLHCTARYWISLLLLHRMDAGCLTSPHCTGRYCLSILLLHREDAGCLTSQCLFCFFCTQGGCVTSYLPEIILHTQGWKCDILLLCGHSLYIEIWNSTSH